MTIPIKLARHRPRDRRFSTCSRLMTFALVLALAAHASADDARRVQLWKSDQFREIVDISERGDRLEQREELDANSILTLKPRIHAHDGMEHSVPIPDTFTSADVFRLSDAGQVVGVSTRPAGHPQGSQLAFVWDWKRNSTELLRPPPGYRGSCAFDISSDGQTACGFVVGRHPPRVEPSVWHRSADGWRCRVLETEIRYNPFLVAGRVAISDNGQLVVASISAPTDSQPNTARRSYLFQWKRDADGNWSRHMLSEHAVHVADVNDHGMVAGRITGRGRRRGYVFDPGSGPHVLEPLAGDRNAEATSLNNHGVVVGVSDDPPGPIGGTEAFVWKHGAMEKVTFPVDVIYSSARVIQDDGQIGGWIVHRSGTDPDQAIAGSFLLRPASLTTNEDESSVR